VSEVLADIRARVEGAMLAAATGDALGWPHEDRRRRADGTADVDPRLEFVEWHRRDGGRYAAHKEIIAPGEYSDDTQLVLAVARTLGAGDEWWERLTRIELPLWLFYERGGGAATKRAARSWAAGKAPWEGDRRAKYFAAGGNGVAMRILPHAIRGSRSDNFTVTLSSVVRDGIATHGHPVAIVGAVAYAYSLWLALRRDRVLEYGALIEQVKTEVDAWSSLPRDLPDGWRSAADAAVGSEYETLWKQTVAAMVELLSVAAGGTEQGALSVDRETLDRLGAFDKRISGAGTVSAASAIFLASRYASRPAQGLVAAAFAHGADTDTLAAMSGGLLGAINGRDWLAGIAKHVQDYDHLISAARALSETEGVRPPPAKPQELRRLWRLLADAVPASSVRLPDGRHGILDQVTEIPTATRHDITRYLVRTDDGQTLFLKKVARTKQAATDPPKPSREPDAEASEDARPSAPTARRRRAIVAIEAADFEQSIRFYRDLIGLELTRRTTEGASFGGDVLIVPSNGTARRQTQLDLQSELLFENRPKIIVFVAAQEFEPLRDQLANARVPITAVTNTSGDRRQFACVDPDGTVVEVREANGG
jgi:ADP-ribosylglycohydrolase/catechol 2,3-dioxygenase-like lactoylglutathione lyase family enzyme